LVKPSRYCSENRTRQRLASKGNCFAGFTGSSAATPSLVLKTEQPARIENAQRAFWYMGYRLDFGSPTAKAPTELEQPRQYVLPFIENIRENDLRGPR
jgi:hypothetical protein